MKIEWTDADAKIRDEIFDAALKHGAALEWNAALVENGCLEWILMIFML